MNKQLLLRALGGAASVAALAAVLTACGGGGGSSDALAPNAFFGESEVPLGATTSAAEATAFVASVTTGASDSAEPLNLGQAVLASSDTDEPADI